MYEQTLPFTFAEGNTHKQAIRRHLLQLANGAVLWKVETVSVNLNHSSCATMHGLKHRR